MTIQFDEDKQKRKLNELLRKEEEDLVQTLSGKYNVEYVNLLGIAVNADALRLVDEKTARESLVAPFALIGKRIKMAVRNPEGPKTLAVIENLKSKGYETEINIASTQSLEKAWNMYKDLSFAYESKSGSLEISNDEISAIVEKAKSLPTIISILENTISAKRTYRVSRILETIVAGALAVDASDIHLEPEETNVRLRYRLDGVLHNVIILDNETYALLLSRIKQIGRAHV